MKHSVVLLLHFSHVLPILAWFINCTQHVRAFSSSSAARVVLLLTLLARILLLLAWFITATQHVRAFSCSSATRRASPNTSVVFCYSPAWFITAHSMCALFLVLQLRVVLLLTLLSCSANPSVLYNYTQHTHAFSISSYLYWTNQCSIIVSRGKYLSSGRVQTST